MGKQKKKQKSVFAIESKKSVGKKPQNTKLVLKNNPQNGKNKKQNKLSKLQLMMQKRLEGGKFRMLNEQLYTTTGEKSFQIFQQEPELFDVYHQGFREQVEKWPANPLDLIIKYVKTKPKAVVADFGCGDAKLASSVKNTVHSFDLVSRNPYVTACDIAKVPLPSKSVDIAVYCLALMGTNLADYILEARRVLKSTGIIKIAEVKSRFENEEIGGIQGFVKIMHNLGLNLKKKDETNKMFVMFDFVISDRKPQEGLSFSLKACEYKRR